MIVIFRNPNFAPMFSPNSLGPQRNAAHRPFYGPGVNNFDVALHKLTKLTESKSLEFRYETFNTFNHAQFDGSGSVDGNINDATFGQGRESGTAAHFTSRSQIPLLA
jgi:hypothetical protein